MSDIGPTIIRVVETPPVIVKIEQPLVKFTFDGAQGVAGPPGAAGPAGPNGPMGTTFIFDQMIASATWVIAHALNRYPSVTVVDSGGTQVEGYVDYLDANTVNVLFSAAFAGTAYLN
jgi:hypothetical protein